MVHINYNYEVRITKELCMQPTASRISPPFLRPWFSSDKYCFFKRRAVDLGTVKCRDAFVRPCSAAYRPIVLSSYLRTILGRVCGVVFFAHLGAGPASSVSLVRLVTRLLASTRASFSSDGVDPEEDRLVVGVE